MKTIAIFTLLLICALIVSGLILQNMFNIKNSIKENSREYEINQVDSGLKLCSINSHFFFGKLERARIERLSKMNCDIYLLSEVRKEGKNYRISDEYVRNHMQEFFPGYNIDKKGEFVIISKYPITKSYLGDFEGYQYASINYNSTNLSIYNTHLILPYKNPLKKQFYNDDKRSLNSFRVKRDQFEALRLDYKSDKNDLIILSGDFNSFYEDGAVRSVKNDLHILESRLNLKTFPSHLPFLRMDYTFVSAAFSSMENAYHIVFDPLLSDHSIQVYNFNLI